MIDPGRARGNAALFLAPTAFFLLISCSGEYASIEGQVTLPDREDNEGTQVYLPGTPYQAITDRDGRFKLPEVQPGDYELVVRREGYIDYRKPGIRARRGSPLRLIAFSLEPEASLSEEGNVEGLVKLEDGLSPGGALVIVENASRLVTVDGLGHYLIPGLKSGDYSLVVVKAGYVAAREPAQVVAGATTTLEPLVLARAGAAQAAQPTGRISGQVKVLGGDSQAGVLVAVEGSNLIASTDAEGLFSIAAVPSGTYTVRFQKDQFFPYRTTNVVVEPEGETELEVTLRPIPSGSLFTAISRSDNIGAIRGFIAIPGATSLEGAQILLEPLGLFAETSPDGKYIFPAVPEGVYSITGRKEGHRSGILIGISVEPGQETFAPQLLLEAIPAEELPPKPSAIKGTVFLEGETRHLGVLVALVDTQHTAMTATDGSYRFQQVMPGEYELLAVKEGFEPVELPVEVPTDGDLIVQPITLKPVIIRPAIVDTIPRDGEREVPVEDYVQIVIQFDQLMDGSSLKRAFQISPQVEHHMYFGSESAAPASHGLPPGLLPNADAFVLQRTEPPPAGHDRLVIRLPRYGRPPVELDQKYRVLITGEAKNSQGISVAEPYEFTFSTGGARLTGTWPEDGATDVYLLEYDALVFDFNAKIDRASFRKAFRIRPKTDSDPLFLPEKAPSGDRVKVEVVLREDTKYTVEIDRSARTSDGKRISNLPYRLEFRTTSIEDLGGDEQDYYEDLLDEESERGRSGVQRHLQRRAERDRRLRERRASH